MSELGVEYESNAHEVSARAEALFYGKLAQDPFRTFSTAWSRPKRFAGMGWFETLSEEDAAELSGLFREAKTAAIPAWQVFFFGRLHRPIRLTVGGDELSGARQANAAERAEVVRAVLRHYRSKQRELVLAVISLCVLSPPGTDVLTAAKRLVNV